MLLQAPVIPCISKVLVGWASSPASSAASRRSKQTGRGRPFNSRPTRLRYKDQHLRDTPPVIRPWEFWLTARRPFPLQYPLKQSHTATIPERGGLCPRVVYLEDRLADVAVRSFVGDYSGPSLGRAG
jgi:hypothetical protein